MTRSQVQVLDRPPEIIFMKKFAIFDIDGTLYRWQLYHELVEYLALDGKLPASAATELGDAWNSWRGGEISFDNYEKVVIGTMVENLPKISVDDFETACNVVVENSAHKTYYYTRTLLKDLKSRGYCIIAITGSQQELIDRFGKVYGFDLVVGSKYERQGNTFTGKTEVMTIGRKLDILKQLVNEHELSWTDSYAIGDSDGDASLLEVVDNPIAFNPSEGLFEQARVEGWPIVVERKNIAYVFGEKHQDLVLKETVTY